VAAILKNIMNAAREAVSSVLKSFQSVAPSPKASCPSTQWDAKALLKNANVRSGLKKAAQDSDIGGKNPVEQGGFIIEDRKTCELSVERWPQGKGASMQPPISKDGTHNGKKIVASFHTHPNVGPGWKQGPSNADVNFVKNHPKTAGNDHFVVSKETVYHIDSKGNVSEAGKTSEVLK
jgi:proteasome lid subunit RPN8/RPN11